MKQLSIEVTDRPGELARVVGVLAKAGIDIKALVLGEGAIGAPGLLKLIVTDPARASRELVCAGYTVIEQPVVVIAVEDHPGGLAAALECLARAELNLTQIYSFVSRREGQALSVLGLSDTSRGAAVLAEAGIRVIEQGGPPAREPDLAAYVGGVFFW